MLIFRYISFFIFSLTLSYTSTYIKLYKHITSKLDTKDLYKSENDVLVATSGGLYSIRNNDIFDIDLLDAVNLTTISTLDNNSNNWVASQNNGVIQILNTDKIVETVISYPDNIDFISDIVHYSSKSYAIGCRGECNNSSSFNDEYFIIEYDGYYYNNIIENIGFNFNIINDLELYENYIYLATDLGMFSANLNDNLLFQDNWSLSYSSENIISICSNLAISSNLIINLNLNETYDYDIDDKVVSLYDFNNNGIFHLLTEDNLYIINNDLSVTQMLFNKPLNIKTPFTSMCYFEDKYYFGLKNSGIAVYEHNVNSWSFIIPNTIFKNQFDSIDIDNNVLVGISKSGGFVMENASSLYEQEIQNFYPFAFSDTSLYSEQFPLSISKFNALVLPYWSGGKKQTSITSHNNNIFFSNSGAYPFINDNIDYHYQPILNEFTSFNSLPDISYFGSLGTFSIGDDNIDLSMKSNGVFGGLGGLLDATETSGYMNVSQITKDSNGNIWAVNPFSENYFENNIRINRPITFKRYNSDDWNHIYDFSSSEHYIPTEIAFSSNNKIWIAYRFYETDDFIYSKGGLRLIDFNDIDNFNDDIWYNINLNEYSNVNVWSIEVSKDDYGNEVLWVLSELGVQGYYYNIININQNNTIIDINPISDEYYFKNIIFREDSKIRIDSNNNIWVITSNEGMRIIYNNGEIFEEVINKENFNILSDNISDITFNDRGFAFVSTDQGISVLNTSFSLNYNPSTLSVSPNPFIINENDGIIFSNVTAKTTVKLMNLSGIVLMDFEIDYNGQKVYWDGKSNNGSNIPTGIYLLASSSPKQNSGVTKIAIIRK